MTEHRYLSTGCLHGEHDYCRNSTGLAGAKNPAQCKFCAAPCICPCHEPALAAQRVGQGDQADEDPRAQQHDQRRLNPPAHQDDSNR